MDDDDDFAVEETLSSTFSIFTKTKLLKIHSFIQEHNSSNLQQSSKSSPENNVRTLPFSDSLHRIKLLRIEFQPFDGQPDLWKEFFNNFERSIDQNHSLSNKHCVKSVQIQSFF